MTGDVSPQAIIAFLGPSGTFTEEALRSEPGLAKARLRALPSFIHVLAAVTDGTADFGFVALENSIEGTVSVALDQLVFERDLMIVGEVVLPVTQNLLAPAGTGVPDIHRVVSFPHATGQCRAWLTANLPDVEEVAARSTAEAARLVGQGSEPGAAAIGTTLAAELYGLEVLVPRIEDRAGNSTRFVLVAPSRDRNTRGRRDMTRRASCAFSRATTRGACTGFSVSSRPGTSTWSSWSHGRPSESWASTASSSTSRATSLMR